MMADDAKRNHAALDWLRRYKTGIETLEPCEIAELFTVDGVYSESPFGPSFAGRDQILAYWRDVASKPRVIAYQYSVVALQEKRIVFQWTMHVLAGDTGSEMDGISIVEFAVGDSRCSKMVEWRHRRERCSSSVHH